MTIYLVTVIQLIFLCKNLKKIEKYFLFLKVAEFGGGSLLQNQNVEKNIKIKAFDVLILPMDLKPIRTSKIYISTTYGILPMVTKACGGLG